MAFMKDLTQFRNALRAWMATEGMSQKSLAQASGVDQASISRFLRAKNPDGLSGESVLRLFPFVYGSDARASPEQPPSLSEPASEARP